MHTRVGGVASGLIKLRGVAALAALAACLKSKHKENVSFLPFFQTSNSVSDLAAAVVRTRDFICKYWRSVLLLSIYIWIWNSIRYCIWFVGNKTKKASTDDETSERYLLIAIVVDLMLGVIQTNSTRHLSYHHDRSSSTHQLRASFILQYCTQALHKLLSPRT